MKYSRTIALATAALLCSFALNAQNLTDLRITEVLVENENGLEDDFGRRSGWIELFNISYGTVNFGGCYLTNDISNLKKYRIPLTDRSASLKPRQSMIFFAGGNDADGTYYTNFTIEKGQTVYLVSNDGRTIIDRLEVPGDLQADKSVMKVPAGIKEMDFETVNNAVPSPGSYNGDINGKSKSQQVKEKDPHGWVLTFISILTVFVSLTVLAFIFTGIGNYSNRQSKPKQKKVSSKNMSPEVAAAISMALARECGGEVYAAIALALDDCLGGGVHDEESYIITIAPSQGSQWNDKTQNFRKTPRK